MARESATLTELSCREWRPGGARSDKVRQVKRGAAMARESATLTGLSCREWPPGGPRCDKLRQVKQGASRTRSETRVRGQEVSLGDGAGDTF